MLKNRKVVALIPARGGSKRVPHKNLRAFLGRPLICWTVSAALECDYIDEVYVSSDCSDILAAAHRSGAQGLVRPDVLATDRSSTDDVIFHCIEELALNDQDIIVILQPTSPLRVGEDIDACMEKYLNENVSGVVSVCECEHSPLWTNVLPRSGSMDSFISPELSKTRSQDLPAYYRLNGAIFSYLVGTFKVNKGRAYTKNIFAYVMDTASSVDIDTEADFLFAEVIGKFKKIAK